jgi:hypothetical protein
MQATHKQIPRNLLFSDKTARGRARDNEGGRCSKTGGNREPCVMGLATAVPPVAELRGMGWVVLARFCSSRFLGKHSLGRLLNDTFFGLFFWLRMPWGGKPARGAYLAVRQYPTGHAPRWSGGGWGGVLNALRMVGSDPSWSPPRSPHLFPPPLAVFLCCSCPARLGLLL